MDSVGANCLLVPIEEAGGSSSSTTASRLGYLSTLKLIAECLLFICFCKLPIEVGETAIICEQYAHFAHLDSTSEK